jgi:hypothetical protein
MLTPSAAVAFSSDAWLPAPALEEAHGRHRQAGAGGKLRLSKTAPAGLFQGQDLLIDFVQPLVPRPDRVAGALDHPDRARSLRLSQAGIQGRVDRSGSAARAGKASMNNNSSKVRMSPVPAVSLSFSARGAPAVLIKSVPDPRILVIMSTRCQGDM